MSALPRKQSLAPPISFCTGLQIVDLADGLANAFPTLIHTLFLRVDYGQLTQSCDSGRGILGDR